MAVELLQGLVAGTILEPPQLEVSEAVAVQIYRLIFDRDASHASLQCAGWHGYYTILASLSFGVRVEPPDKAAEARL